jgi:O-acetyl-ADP-ribose deacetylase (regulator of RNase III)
MNTDSQKAVIESVSGNIFDSNADAIVNAVNCVGVMGKGLALQFKKRFPDNFKIYKESCAHQELRPGNVLVYDRGELEKPRFIINFPTKDHWKQPSEIGYIDSGLESLAGAIQKHDISSIAIPALGCGLGGLQWAEVRPRIVEALSPITDLTVYIYDPKPNS